MRGIASTCRESRPYGFPVYVRAIEARICYRDLLLQERAPSDVLKPLNVMNCLHKLAASKAIEMSSRDMTRYVTLYITILAVQPLQMLAHILPTLRFQLLAG